MSRNGHAVLGRVMANGHMGTAYAPDAEGGAEGNRGWYETRRIGTRIDPGTPTYMRGLREDDASLLLRGLREDDAALMLKGLREDDADLRLRGLREDDAALMLRGLREDDADLRLKGLREDDAALMLRGLREDDAALMLRGLREDDADLRLRGGSPDWWPGAEAAAADQYGKLGQPGMMVSDGRTGYMGTAYSPDAEGGAEGNRGWYEEKALRGAYAPDAQRSAEGDQSWMGTRIDPGTPAYMRAAYSADARGGNRGWYDRGYGEGFPRGFKANLYKRGFTQLGAQETYYENEHRFPVSVEIKGIGRLEGRIGARGVGAMKGLFDFLKAGMTWDAARSKLQTLIQQEAALQARLSRLPAASQAAVIKQASAMKNNELFDGQLLVYLNEGEPGWVAHAGREIRLTTTEAAIPTFDKVITQLEQGLPPSAANQAAINDLNNRINGLQGGIMDYALPAVGVAAGIGLLVALWPSK